jgi:NADH dehydrogenase FAD-containing subunit
VFASASDTPAAGQAKPRAKAQPVYTLYAAGDIANCAKKPALQTAAAQTANLIAAALEKDPQAFAVTLGDNTYPVGAPSEFTECYEPTWGRFKERTLPSPGNHDYGQPKALGYYNYFGELAGPDRRGYYSKKLGNWTLYSLNSQLSGNAMQAQLQWLKEELQKTKAAAHWRSGITLLTVPAVTAITSRCGRRGNYWPMPVPTSYWLRMITITNALCR